MTASNAGPTEPEGFSFGSPPLYYDVDTTATFTGTVELCFHWAEGDIANEANVRLFHYENGAWVDVTKSVNTDANTVCGDVTSLSPFAVAEIKYGFELLPPIKADGSSILKTGRVLPLKIRLTLPDGSVAADVPVRLQLFKTSDTVSGTEEVEIDPASAGQANTDDFFRYDPDSGSYLYNLSTQGFTEGTYRVLALPDDGSVHEVIFSLR